MRGEVYCFELARCKVGNVVLSIGHLRFMTSSTWFGQNRHTIERLIVAVFVGTIIHAVACIIKRPFEFGNGSRLHTFFCAFVSGLMTFPILFAVLLLPLRAILRRYIQQRTKWTHVIIAALGLLLLVWTWILVRFLSGVELPPFCHGYLCHSLFWSFFVVSIAASFFWPDAPGNMDLAWQEVEGELSSER
jgi:NADH:ubiquinone oxidoreductase subunit 2 (subunit N)